MGSNCSPRWGLFLFLEKLSPDCWRRGVNRNNRGLVQSRGCRVSPNCPAGTLAKIRCRLLKLAGGVAQLSACFSSIAPGATPNLRFISRQDHIMRLARLVLSKRVPQRLGRMLHPGKADG